MLITKRNKTTEIWKFDSSFHKVSVNLKASSVFCYVLIFPGVPVFLPVLL